MTTFEYTPSNVMSFLAMFECERCNECERNLQPPRIFVTEKDAVRIANHLGITEDEFREHYTYTVNKIVSSKIVKATYMPAPCKFWDGFSCKIWDVKPEVCCQFPFNQPVKCGNKMMITINTKCPAGKKLAEKFAINPETVGVG